MPQVGKETINKPAINDRHGHTLLPKGKTSTANGHTHSWNNRRNKTSEEDGHYHLLPLRDDGTEPEPVFVPPTMDEIDEAIELIAEALEDASEDASADEEGRSDAESEEGSEPEGLQDEE